MGNHIIHTVIDELNNSETYVRYADWFSSPNLTSMLLFFVAALMTTVNLMPLGKKA